MKLSEIAWQKSANVVDAIKNHPFNTELSAGNLALDKFAYYIEQDSLYLQDFARSLASIAARVPIEYMKDFLLFSDFALIAEQEVVHRFFRDTFNLQATGKLTSATLCYTSYLLQTCYTAPLEVAVAAILPCFWVYQEVGAEIARNVKSDNQYWRWIETYSGEEFEQRVRQAIGIFDKLAGMASEKVQQQMIAAFYRSAVLEWHFWNDAYHKQTFDDLK